MRCAVLCGSFCPSIRYRTTCTRLRVVHHNRNPASRRLGDLGVLATNKTGNRGACEIDVKDSNGLSLQRKRERELEGDGGLANPALAGQDLLMEVPFSQSILLISLMSD
jgi:hypothetical protein